MKKILYSVKSVLVKKPDEIMTGIYARISGDKMRRLKWIVMIAVITTIMDYFYLMINGYCGPDAIIEGSHLYFSPIIQIRSMRWFIPYLNGMVGKNAVIPYVIVLLYGVLIALSVFLLSEMIELTELLPNILITSAMVSFPVVTRQYAFLYMALSYALSFFMVTFAAYLFRKRRVWSILLGTVALIIMFGSYQAYLAAAMGIVVMMFIYDMCKGRKIKETFIDVVIYGVCGVVSGVVNIGIAKLNLNAYGMESYDRVQPLSVKESLTYLKSSLKFCYSELFKYFSEDMLGRRVLYRVLIALVIGMTVYYMVRLLSEGKIAHANLLAIGFLILPVAINFCVILFPHVGVSILMKYQYVLLIPLAFMLGSMLPGKKIIANCVRWVICLSVFVLVAGYAVTAITTQMGYKKAYEATETQARLILNDVYDVEGYVPGETKVILAGGIDWSNVLFDNLQLFSYNQMEAGPVFWGGVYGLTICRERYFKDYLGVNLGTVSNQEYFEAIESEEFAAMPVWPAKGSVDWVGDVVVVKMTDSPPFY